MLSVVTRQVDIKDPVPEELLTMHAAAAFSHCSGMESVAAVSGDACEPVRHVVHEPPQQCARSRSEEIHSAPCATRTGEEGSSSDDGTEVSYSTEVSSVDETVASSSLNSAAGSCAPSLSQEDRSFSQQGLRSYGSSSSLRSVGSDGAEGLSRSGSPRREDRLKGCRIGTCVMIGRCICRAV